MNEIAQWIQQYGYVAVFIGTFFEGESVALLGGFIAHGELLDLKARDAGVVHRFVSRRSDGVLAGA